MSATTQAMDWWQARNEGRRLPEHELAEAVCDLCGHACDADDFNQVAGLFICTVCTEHQLEAQAYERAH